MFPSPLPWYTVFIRAILHIVHFEHAPLSLPLGIIFPRANIRRGGFSFPYFSFFLYLHFFPSSYLNDQLLFAKYSPLLYSVHTWIRIGRLDCCRDRAVKCVPVHLRQQGSCTVLYQHNLCYENIYNVFSENHSFYPSRTRKSCA